MALVANLITFTIITIWMAMFVITIIVAIRKSYFECQKHYLYLVKLQMVNYC